MPSVTNPIFFDLPEEINLEKIFGANHLKKITWLEKGLQISKSVCRVVTPTDLGSGFLAKDGYLLTNNHVIDSVEVAKSTFVDFNYQEDLHGKMLHYYRYSLDSSTFRTNKILDYSIVKIDENSNLLHLSSLGFLDLDQDAKPSINDHVSIIQHPEGGPKQIALTANQVVNIFEHRLQYTTDTLSGSSGSPVFNDDWKVIAIHHAGGNLLMNKLGQKRFANEGILISYILNDLNFNS